MRVIKQKIVEYILETDKWLWLLCPLVSLVSVVLLYGVLESGYRNLLGIEGKNLVVQCGAVALGLVAALVMSKIDYHFMARAWVVHVPLAYLLVMLTFLIGVGVAERADDKRWLIIPVIDVWLQPAELLKISFIVVFAYHISKGLETLNKPLNLILLCVHAAVPVVLIHIQGDTGTALLIGITAITMLFIAGVGWRYILLALGGAAALIPVVWNYVLSPFQQQRILTLFNQAEADPLGQHYQQYQSKLAIAMGEVTGVGLLDTRHIYVPEMHNDFIFSFLCESFGLMGALGVLVLMGAICMKILFNASRAEDSLGSLICGGVFAMIFFQMVVNIGMCLSVLPVIGNPFPFLSYGGSSVLTNYMGVGLVLSVYMHRRKGMFVD